MIKIIKNLMKRHNARKNFFIKSGYISRVLPQYFLDNSNEIIHQPYIYSLAAYLGQLFGCTHIIDIGCGKGEKLTELYPRFQIIGIDYGENLLQCRRQYKFGSWTEWNFDKSEILKISKDILNNSIIVCADVIEHMKNPNHLLENLRNYLCHAQICILSTPERDLVRGINSFGPPENLSHVREWNLSEFKNILLDKKLNLKFIGLTINNNRDYEKKTIVTIIEKNIYKIPKKSSDVKLYENTLYNFRVTAIMTAYNEEDIIISSIKRLAEQGIDVYVIDNWSTDTTYDQIKNFQCKRLIGYERFPKKGPSSYYDWKDLLHRVEELTTEIKTDWFVHHDVDEIRMAPWPDVSLKEGIYIVDKEGFNSIDHTVITFWPTDNGFVPGSNFGKHFKYFEFGKRPGHFLQIKTWKNFGQKISLLESGGHEARFEERRIYPYKFLLKHYPIRSQNHGYKKIFYDRKKRWNPGERTIGWHTQYDDIKEGQTFLYQSSKLELFDETIFNDRYLIERLSGIGILNHSEK